MATTRSEPHALVTGGAGFIGSHLCEWLMEQGWRVSVLDDLSTGSEENLARVIHRTGFCLHIGSAENEALIDSILSDGVNMVFHLASVVGVQKVMADTVDTIARMLHSTDAVLQVCNRRKVKILITSSSEVYGDSDRERFREDDPAVIGPSHHRRWCYAAGKLMDEFNAYAYYHSYGLPVIVVRLFNTIGPRQVGRYGMVVPRFIRQALAGKPLTVYGDGMQSRSFTDVRDVVKCLLALASTEAAVGRTFNIGGSTEIRIRDLAERIRALSGSASGVEHLAYEAVYGERFDDMRRRVPDVSRLRETIGFAPETPLDEILEETIAWMRERQAAGADAAGE